MAPKAGSALTGRCHASHRTGASWYRLALLLLVEVPGSVNLNGRHVRGSSGRLATSDKIVDRHAFKPPGQYLGTSPLNVSSADQAPGGALRNPMRQPIEEGRVPSDHRVP